MNPRGKRRRFGKNRIWQGKGPGRPISSKNVKEPTFKQFLPVIPPNLIEKVNKNPIFLYYDELEATRLVDHENLTQEQAGVEMGVSRGTIWRLVQSARTKILTSILEGQALYIIPRE